MADKRVVLTEEGLKKLEEKLEYLKSVRRLEVADRLKAAIALGDLSENSEYDDAKNEQAFIEGEILTLEKQIRNSEIIKADVPEPETYSAGMFIGTSIRKLSISGPGIKDINFTVQSICFRPVDQFHTYFTGFQGSHIIITQRFPRM